MGISYFIADKVAKMIPLMLGVTIESALNINHELKKLYDEDDTVKKLIDMAKTIEGMPRHASTHVVGVVKIGRAHV